jgi:hypothetical protein
VGVVASLGSALIQSPWASGRSFQYHTFWGASYYVVMRVRYPLGWYGS